MIVRAGIFVSWLKRGLTLFKKNKKKKKTLLSQSFVHRAPVPIRPGHPHHVLGRPKIAHVEIFEPGSDLAPEPKTDISRHVMHYVCIYKWLKGGLSGGV